MAERAAVTLLNDGTRVIIRWTGLLNGDTGAWVKLPWHGDKSAIAYGTFGVGGTVRVQGSNEIVAAPANPVNLQDPPSTAAIGLTAANPVEAVLENTHQVRPNVTAGDGTTTLTVDMLFLKTGR